MPSHFPLRILTLCGCITLAGSASIFADSSLTPIGGESTIAGALAGDQTSPQVSLTAEGGCLVWQDNSVSSLGLRIKAERLDANFSPVGAPFVVSSAWKSKTAGDQEQPQVLALSGGRSLVVWQGAGRGLRQIYARFIEADGTFSKSDIRVGSHTQNNQVNPAVAILSNNTIAIVWSSFDQDGSRAGVFAQLISTDGAKIGTEFQVNQFTLNNQRNPAVTVLANGNFVVSWVSELQVNPASSVDIFARIYNPAGAPVVNEFPVSISTSNACANPALAASATGGFVVAWSQRDDAGRAVAGVVNGSTRALSQNGWDIFARFFDENGSPIMTPFRVNETTYGDQYVPKLSALGTNFLAVWTSLGQDGSREGIYGQVFSANGDFQGSEFRVNTTTISRQIQPAITSNGQNRFLAVWSSPEIGTGFDLFAQTYLLTSGQ